MGWTIVKAISDLENDKEYTFDKETGLPNYDITIKKTIKGDGSRASDFNYSVIPSRKDTPLTKEEKEEISKLTPIADIVMEIKEKALRNYEEMGMGTHQIGDEVVDIEEA